MKGEVTKGSEGQRGAQTYMTPVKPVGKLQHGFELEYNSRFLFQKVFTSYLPLISASGPLTSLLTELVGAEVSLPSRQLLFIPHYNRSSGSKMDNTGYVCWTQISNHP